MSRIYNIPVFFAKRLLFEDDSDMFYIKTYFMLFCQTIEWGYQVARTCFLRIPNKILPLLDV